MGSFGASKQRLPLARAEMARQYILEHIIRNELHTGDPLPPEGQVAQELGVSRGSVREAVKALQSLGIVDVRHGEGLYVRGISFDSLLELLTFGARFDPPLLADLLQVRTWLEVAAVEDAVKSIDEAHVHQMERCLREWEENIRKGTPVSKVDRQFHHALYSVLGNRVLLELLDVFWKVFSSIGIEDIKRDPTPLATLKEHRAIFEAVKKRDPAAAREAIICSNAHIMERIRQVIDAARQTPTEGGTP